MNRSRMVKFIVAVCLLLVCTLWQPPVPTRAADPSADKPVFSFAVFSDVHVHADWSPSHSLSVEKFTNALRDVETLHPKFVVVNGDLTNGRPADYGQLLAAYHANVNFPLYPTMGNHDYYYEWQNKQWNDKRAQQEFKKAFQLNRIYYDRFEHGMHFIFLSPEEYMPQQRKIGEAAWLSPQQINWFEKTLLKSKAPTFVFLHQPLNKTVFSVDHGLSAVQTDQLLAIARRHPQVIWFSGHSHISADSKTEAVRKDGILFVGTGSVFQPEDLSEKPTPGAEKYGKYYLVDDPVKSESRFVDVYKDRIVIRTRHHQNKTWGRDVVQVPLSAAPTWSHMFTRLFPQ